MKFQIVRKKAIFLHLLSVPQKSYMQRPSLLLCCCSITVCRTLILCDPMDYSKPGFPVLQYLSEFAQLMSIESMMPSNHLILCLSLLLLPSIFPSIRKWVSLPMSQLFASGHKLEDDEKCPVCGYFFKYLNISVSKSHHLAPGKSGVVNCFCFFLKCWVGFRQMW